LKCADSIPTAWKEDRPKGERHPVLGDEGTPGMVRDTLDAQAWEARSYLK
jgi:hypothetical protein